MPKNVGLHKGMVMIHGLRAELELFKEIWTAILNFKMAYITDTFFNTLRAKDENSCSCLPSGSLPRTRIRVFTFSSIARGKNALRIFTQNIEHVCRMQQWLNFNFVPRRE